MTVLQCRLARALLALLLALTLALGALAAAPVPRARAALTVAVTMATDTANAACYGSVGSPPTGTPCSLRDAVRFANGRAAAESTTITLPAGVYGLTTLGSGEFSSVTGDLNILRNVTIVGAGAATTIIDGQAADRIFTSFADATVAIRGVTLRNGKAVGGGALSSSSPSDRPWTRPSPA